MASPSSVLALAFNHVVLPPKLPGRQDKEAVTEEVDRELTRRLLRSVESLKDLLDDESALALNFIAKSLMTCNLVNPDGFINQQLLLNAFREVESDTAIILHVSQQNASLLIRQPQ